MDWTHWTGHCPGHTAHGGGELCKDFTRRQSEDRFVISEAIWPHYVNELPYLAYLIHRQKIL